MIKRERSALPLPRYVLRKPSPQGIRFFFKHSNLGARARLSAAQRAARR